MVLVEPPFDLGRFDGKLEAACLPSPGHEPYGYATVSGWGTLKEGTLNYKTTVLFNNCHSEKEKSSCYDGDN